MFIDKNTPNNGKPHRGGDSGVSAEEGNSKKLEFII
jgi:hypothetical protein